MKVSESYTFHRRRIFRRRGFWSSRASLTLVVFLGAIFGYLLPEILSSGSVGPASFGERAFGQVGAMSPTDSATMACDVMDCTGTPAGPMSLVAPETLGHCTVGGKCTIPSITSGLESEFVAVRAEMSAFPLGAR